MTVYQQTYIVTVVLFVANAMTTTNKKMKQHAKLSERQ